MSSILKECKIDEAGIFKYVQIHCINKINKDESKVIIRGTCYFSFHKEIFNDFLSDVRTSGNKSLLEDYDYKCIGGGKIEYRPDKIYIYGHSTLYGQADHNLTAEILKKYYPNHSIEISTGLNEESF